VDGVAPLQVLDLEGRHGDVFRAQVGQGGVQAREVVARGEDGEIGVAAKLRCAVQDAGLTPHQEALDLALADRGKDSADRAQGQAGP
jgi:hypothetical protein